MRSLVRSLAGALIAFGSIATCSVDEAGLGSGAPGAGGSTGGSAAPVAVGTGGAGAAVGTAGRGGATGVAGGGGVAGTGVAGVGVAGTGGSGGGLGGADPGNAGAAGTSAAGGGAGASDVAGQGGGGAAGTGMAGTGGAAGTTGPTCGPNSCPNGCFRCGTQGSCEPTPSAHWTVICQSAVIAAMKSSGATWDAPPPATSGAAPDAFCELIIDNDHVGETAVVSDSLTPTWDQPVNSTSGTAVTASLLMSSLNRWRIAIVDQDIQPPGSTENICQITPHLTAEDLQRGMVTVMAGSCSQINLGLTCDEN